MEALPSHVFVPLHRCGDAPFGIMGQGRIVLLDMNRPGCAIPQPERVGEYPCVASGSSSLPVPSPWSRAPALPAPPTPTSSGTATQTAGTTGFGGTPITTAVGADGE